MMIKTQTIFFIFLIFVCNGSKSLYADSNTDLTINTVSHNQDRYLLPADHPLQGYLKRIFNDPNMFQSPEHFRKAGFKVKGGERVTRSGHRKIMVGAHPSITPYLFKKFPDSYQQTMQLENFMRRIKGAEIIRNYIQQYNFKHLIVPQKWLYKLPKAFSKNKIKSYLLVVEKMDIYDDWDDPKGKARKLYYNMDKEVLTELCILLHAVKGCDAYPRNQPFTRSGQIAFIDTEHIGKKSDHFLTHIVPALNEELQAYAIALWEKLEE